jgi:uncharacterized protein
VRNSRSRVAACAAVATALSALLAAPAQATPSDGVVLNEVYGGGGNSGATLRNDFIELANRAGADQDLTGWSVQYISASPTSTTTWQVTSLSASIAAGQTYLIAEAAGSGGTEDLPPAQVTGSINMSGSSGTVALVADTAPLTCKTAEDCAANPAIVDLVGYGSAVVREGTDAPGQTSTVSDQRTSAPDTDDNGIDFTADAPTPTAGPPQQLRIHDIQGAAFRSPLAGQTVADVPGVVTGVRAGGSSKGYWLQDPEPDADPATSEGIFVYTGSTPTVAIGDSVTVSGTVSDFYPLSSGDTVSTTSNLSITELGSATTTVVSSGNALPDPVMLGPGNVPDQYAPDLGGHNIENTPLDPARSALDFYESLEGMRVGIHDARVVGPSNDFGEQYVTSRPEQAPTYRGGTELLGENQTPSGRLEVIPLDGSAPGVDVNDVFLGDTVGPLDYSQFGGYVLAATELGTIQHNNLPPVVATPAPARQLSIATYNVENLAPSDAQEKYDRLAAGVVDNLASPDIVAVEEVQDNSGATDDGVVAADQTLTKLKQAIVAAGGPAYSWREIDPVDDKDGGQPGGNIRVVFLFDPTRVSFVAHGSGTVDRSVTGTRVTNSGGVPGLTLSPGRIDPTNPVWTSSRKPLVGQFRFGGQDVFVVANHFDSKGGDQNADGRFQYPARSSETQRAGQALVVHNFVRSILAVQPRSEVVVLGDLNDYQFSPALNVLKTGHADGTGVSRLTDLITTLPIDEQYTYVFDGISQVLDHILVTNRIRTYHYQVVHVNAEYAEQVSDHDPQVVQFRP